MFIACILLASAAAVFAVLWRLERRWFLARDAGCFCRRRWYGAAVTDPREGCPAHDPETWRRYSEAILHSEFARMLGETFLEASPVAQPPGHPGTATSRAVAGGAPARAGAARRRHIFRPAPGGGESTEDN